MKFLWWLVPAAILAWVYYDETKVAPGGLVASFTLPLGSFALEPGAVMPIEASGLSVGELPPGTLIEISGSTYAVQNNGSASPSAVVVNLPGLSAAS